LRVDANGCRLPDCHDRERRSRVNSTLSRDDG
jgi:hypothetical protein